MADSNDKNIGVSIAILTLFSAFLTFYGMQYQSWERQIEAVNKSWEKRIERHTARIELLEAKIDELMTAKSLCDMSELDLKYKMMTMCATKPNMENLQ